MMQRKRKGKHVIQARSTEEIEADEEQEKLDQEALALAEMEAMTLGKEEAPVETDRDAMMADMKKPDPKSKTIQKYEARRTNKRKRKLVF